MLFRSETTRLECAEQVATLWLEVDRLTPTTLNDIQEALSILRHRAWADVLLIRSQPRQGFPTRPSLGEYELLSDATSRREFSRLGQETFEQLAGLSSTTRTIALLDGECVDAGLELALACDFRLAVARPETRFGATYLHAGLLPCWGLTQRLPRRIGPQAACDFLEQDQLVDARTALKLGLVDHVFGPRMVKSQVWWIIAEVQDQARQPKRPGLLRRLSDATWLADRSVFRPRILRSSSLPARRVLEVMRTGWRYGESVGYLAERTAFAEAGLHPDVADRRQLACRFETARAAWNRVSSPQCIGVSHLDEGGVRLMLTALANNHRVVIPPCADEKIEKLLRLGVERRHFSFLEAGERRRNIVPSEVTQSSCDVLFLTGRLNQERERLVEIERSLPAETVLVLTTSALPNEGAAETWAHPQRVVSCDGSALSLGQRSISIWPGEATSEGAIARLFQWLARCGFRPVVQEAESSTHSPIEPSLMPAA